MTDDGGSGGPDIGRRAYLGILGSGMAGLAGCNTGTGGNTETPEGTSTDTPPDTETETETPEETETSTPEEPDFREGVPIEGFDLYEQRLENSDTSELGEEQGFWHVMKAELEGKEPMEAASTFADMATDTELLGQEHQEIVPDNVYQLTKAMYEAKSKGADIPDLMVNVDFMEGTAYEPLLEISPVQNGAMQSPLLVTPWGRSTPEGGREGVEQVREDSPNGNILPYNVSAVKTVSERIAEDSEEEARQYREVIQPKMSYAIHGVEDDEDIVFLDNSLFEAKYVERDAEIFNELNRTVEDNLGEGITGVAYDEEEGWMYTELEDFEYGDPLPEVSEVF